VGTSSIRAIGYDALGRPLPGADARVGCEATSTPDGRPLTGVITWADTRSAGAAKALRGRLDETAVHARRGAPLHSTFLPAKLTWLRESRPDVFARKATWCGFAEYLLLRFTGRLRASVSMASGTGRFARLQAAARRSWPWVFSAARLPHPSRRGLRCTPTPAVATSTPLRELARTTCTRALWGAAYLEKIRGCQETPDPCESRSAVTTPVFR
jgi:hypothetical protein